jgi:hypothetical protein
MTKPGFVEPESDTQSFDRGYSGTLVNLDPDIKTNLPEMPPMKCEIMKQFEMLEVI